MAAPLNSRLLLGMLYDKLEPSFGSVLDSTFGSDGIVSMLHPKVEG